MNKKGITWGTIVTAIIAVVVLLVIVWMFREQIGEISKGFFNLIKGVSSESKDLGEEISDIINK